jgi:hypothetical protein
MANVANDSNAGVWYSPRTNGYPTWQLDQMLVPRPGTTYTNASGTVSRPTSGQLFPRGVAAGENRVV